MPIDLSAARDRHRAGDLAAAADAYRRALAESPDRHEALYLLGMVRLQSGDPAGAEPLFARALEFAPGEPSYLVGMAEIHQSAGRRDLAVAHYRAALAAAPDRADWWSNLGATLVDLGRFDEACAAFETAARLRPDLAAVRHNLGNALRLKGDAARAALCFSESIRLDPNFAEPRAALAALLLDRGDAEEALGHAVAATRAGAGGAHRFVILGNVLQTLGRLGEAEAAFREAIRLAPNDATARAALGGVLEQAGDVEGSALALREALRLDPRHAGALARTANRLRGATSDADLESLESLSLDPSTPIERRRAAAFGVCAVREARGEYERAAVAATEANRLRSFELKRAGRAYDPRERAAFVDRVIAAFTPEFFERTRGFGRPTDRPVFVIGPPRSGTSLVEQILASHSRVVGVGESPAVDRIFMGLTDRGADVAGAMERLDRAGVLRAADAYLAETGTADADRVVDKMPENTQALGLIAALFPNARIVECRRDLRDAAVSCWTTDFARVRWASDPDHIAFHFQTHERLMNHWRRVLPSPILRVDYESVVADAETQARRLVEFCGLEWEPACLEFHANRRAVRTASAAQVRRPIYSSSVGRHRNHPEFVARFEAAFGRPAE